MATSPTAVLIIRAWIEAGSAEPLRARVQLTTDISAGFDRELTLSRADAVHAVVDAWLRAVLLDSGRWPNQNQGPPDDMPR